MAGRLAGKYLWLTAIALFIACVPPITRDDSLNPKLLFTVGSSFLDNSSTIAIKGRMEFESNNSIQTGSFIQYIKGPDSLSFLIEGPFSADAFRMVIIDSAARILGDKDEGWRDFYKGETIDIPDYGLENLSPFLIGSFLFPQSFIHPQFRDDKSQEYDIDLNGEILALRWNYNTKTLSLYDQKTGISAIYSRKKSFGNGYYPAKIIIEEENKSWRISLQITKVVLNKEIPLKVWLTD